MADAAAAAAAAAAPAAAAAAAASTAAAAGVGAVIQELPAPLLISAGQVSFLLAYLWAVGLYVYSTLLHRRRDAAQQQQQQQQQPPQPPSALGKVHLSDPDIESKTHNIVVEATGLLSGAAKDGAAVTDATGGGGGGGSSSSSSGGGLWRDFASTGLVKCLALDQQAIMDARGVLEHLFEFGTLLLWFYLCDRTDVFWEADKSYSRDLFVFLFAALTAVALGASLQPVRTPLLLNRPQTEEWKGWMQVLFLLYHYFEAREWYNAIRIFIAGYVWMTGFGNFSYYYRTGDFSVGRFAQMMWRLNFLVAFCCVVLQNSYMLYYICPMHTIFTIFVYAALGLAPGLNKRPGWMWAKIGLCFAFVFVLWDLKPVFYAAWAPFRWLVGYVDPRKGAGQDDLHEWHFRSGLDRYVWIYGMVCAYAHPTASKLLAALEELPAMRRHAARAAVLGACAAVGWVYWVTVFTLPKLEYNRVHPYTSWIPLTLWIVVRNVTPKMRTYSMRLYGWLGCITLETYLCQFHIWLRSDVPDGQPKALLAFVPGYPLVNFAVVTAMYVAVSHRLFHLTNELKDAVVPHDDNRTLARNCVQMALLVAGAAAVGWVVHSAVVLHFL